MSQAWPAALADAVLALHAGIALFVVAGLPLILVGGPRGWRWVRDPGWRLAHLAAIGIVVAEAWLGLSCPLTALETWLRGKAGGATYRGGFVEHWLSRLLYWDAPAWLFVLAYSAFGLLALYAWMRWPPRSLSSKFPFSLLDRRKAPPWR